MMTTELGVQIADALLLATSSTDCSSNDDTNGSSLAALAAVALQTLAAFPPETLFSKIAASCSSSSLSQVQLSPQRLFASSLAVCVQVWGPESPTIKTLVAAECLPALRSIGISMNCPPFNISVATSDKSMLCARVLPRETISAIEYTIKMHPRDPSVSSCAAASELNDSCHAWSCLYRCLCTALKNTPPDQLPMVLPIISLMLPQLACAGPTPALSTVDAIGDALQRRLQKCGDADAGTAVRMCKESLQKCLLSTSHSASSSSFDVKSARFILQARVLRFCFVMKFVHTIYKRYFCDAFLPRSTAVLLRLAVIAPQFLHGRLSI
jgi:hypothetical protein